MIDLVKNNGFRLSYAIHFIILNALYNNTYQPHIWAGGGRIGVSLHHCCVFAIWGGEVGRLVGV